MFSRLITLLLLSVSPLLLACGSWGELRIVRDNEPQALLTICNPDETVVSMLPDCQTLQSQLEEGETIVIREGWFNFFLARGELPWDVKGWRSQTGNGSIVNRITPSAAGQWTVEVWLLKDEELHAITDVFPYLSAEFWEILDASIFSDALYSEAVIATSERMPIDWDRLTPEHRDYLSGSSELQTLLELFGGNQLVFTGNLEIHTVVTRSVNSRSCTAELEALFGPELHVDEFPTTTPSSP